jgi:hypothetical protein
MYLDGYAPPIMNEHKSKYDKADQLMNIIGLETFDHYIRCNDLYDILTDENKLSDVLRKLKLKAFL